MILVTTTVLTLRLARGEEATHVRPSQTGGATVYRPGD